MTTKNIKRALDDLSNEIDQNGGVLSVSLYTLQNLIGKEKRLPLFLSTVLNYLDQREIGYYYHPPLFLKSVIRLYRKGGNAANIINSIIALKDSDNMPDNYSNDRIIASFALPDEDKEAFLQIRRLLNFI